ncbi:sensor histidine kinase [Kaistia dalseonensis]|uniref:histidine kinase n=1 Tax=Kaistia dalseonensis TaxID=410840 RepID=A0ABU0H8R1_9HYPH|nr:sensor histidine kinase [Kaistia dalseonensis]MCX5496086.1 sensor histidine kinase [Kaistia dalseonensis]MDQ0438691.1 signal transduction histidine kinase [Kaistia dalseonensis]
MTQRQSRNASAFAFAAILIILLLVALHAKAEDAASRAFPTMAVAVLKDRPGTMTLDDVRSEGVRKDFKSISGSSINFGYTRDTIWLRLDIRSTESREMLVSLTPNFVDLIDVYVLPPNGGAGAPVHYAMGDHRPLSDDALSGLDNVVPIALEAGQLTEVFVRAAATNSVMTLQASLYSPTDHTSRTSVSSLIFGWWFGGMTILLIIQLVFFYYNRMPAFALLAVSTFFAMMVYFGTLGLSRIFLFPSGGEGNDMFTAIVSWLGISASVLAARSILDVPGKAPWVDRIFIAGALIGAAGGVLALVGYNIEFGPFAHLTIVIVVLTGAVQSMRTIEPSDSSTKLRAAAFLVLAVGVLFTMAQRSGVVPLPDWVAHGYAASTVMHSVLLTGALAVYLRTSEVMSARITQEALAMARDAEGRAIGLVEERTRDLAVAKSVAEEALAAELASKEQQIRFMEVISHQYRTPLAAVQTHISNIGMSLPKDDAANRRRLDRVRKGIARLVEVLEVNLSRSRLQGSAFEPRLERHLAVPLLEAAVARARDLLQIELTCVVAPDARHQIVEADTDMLEIAVINVLENAAKFSHPASKDAISVGVSVTGDALVIEIADQGIGIPDGELPRLLEPNFRASNATKVPGTGTGLSLVARVAATHRGKVEVRSTLGVGTTVRMLIPLADRGRPSSGAA